VRLLPATILALFVIGSASARAQDCAGPMPVACPLLRTAKAIFVGTVTQDDPKSPTLRFRVTEAFKGVEDGYVDLARSPFQFNFQVGQQYLIFAVSCDWPGTDSHCLTIWSCSYTRPVETAAAIVEQLRAEKSGKRVAAVYGTLVRTLAEDREDWMDGYRRPLANILVRLRSDDKTFETRTDAEGAYAFQRVPPGIYQASADLPADLILGNEILEGPVKPFELPRRCCFENDLYALPSGRITGKVIGPDGQGLHSAVVYLYLASRYKNGKTGSYSLQGKWRPAAEWRPFEFSGLPGGDYVLVFNPKNEENPDAPFPTMFYPGANDLESSRIIHLADGEQLNGADIHVGGPLPTRRISVRLLWGDRNPQDFYPPQVLVHASRGVNPFPEEASRESYSLNLLLNAHYLVHAEAICPMGATGKVETPEVSVDGSDLSVSEVALEFRYGECKSK
jgi:hypothetical protein